MDSFKWTLFSISVFLLISTMRCDSTRYEQQRSFQEVRSVAGSQSSDTPPYWEHILREFVFRTLSPPPPGNNALYRRLLNAPFYGGPLPILDGNEDSVVLSRGDVYYLPNNHWMLCQEGCRECGTCEEQKSPTIKWILRRIKRLSYHGSPRYDLQLTLIPQVDGSYHMNNLWPRSYVYVTSQGEQAAYSFEESGYPQPGSALAKPVDVPDPRTRSDNFWRPVDPATVKDRRKIGVPNDFINVSNDSAKTERENDGAGTKEGGRTTERQKFRNSRRNRTRSTEKPLVEDSTESVNFTRNERVETRRLLPKLILGTDQRGQRHLVHVVPAEQPSLTASTDPLQSVVGQVVQNKGTQSNRTAYQRIFRRILDSLNTHRRSIESFLETPSKKLGRNPELTKTGSTDRAEEPRQEETRGGFAGLRQVGHFHRGSDETNKTRSSHRQWPVALNWSRQRRKPRVEEDVSTLLNNTGVVHRSLDDGTSTEATIRPNSNKSSDAEKKDETKQLELKQHNRVSQEKKEFSNVGEHRSKDQFGRTTTPASKIPGTSGQKGTGNEISGN